MDGISKAVLIWNATAMTVSTVYHIVRLIYERRKVKILEQESQGHH